MTTEANRHAAPIGDSGLPTQGEPPAAGRRWDATTWFTLGWVALLVAAGLATLIPLEDLELALSLERFLH